MKKRSFLVAILILFTFNFTALAQEEEERDVIEISFLGGLGIPGNGLTDWETGGEGRSAKVGFDIGMDIGYFVTPKLVVGLNFVYTQFPFGNTVGQSNQRHRLYNPNLLIKYLFEGESNWVPYVKGYTGLENPKFSTFAVNVAANRYRELSYDPVFALGASLGLFYYTADYSGLFLEAGYHHAFSKNAEAFYLGDTYRFGKDLSLYDVRAGIRILFSKGG